MAGVIASADAGWGRIARVLARLPRLLSEARAAPAGLPLFVGGRLTLLRRLIQWAANRLAHAEPDQREVRSGALLVPDLDDCLDQLHHDGIATGLLLRPTLVADIRGYADGPRLCHGGRDWGVHFRADEQPEAERRHGVPLPIGHFETPDPTARRSRPSRTIPGAKPSPRPISGRPRG